VSGSLRVALGEYDIGWHDPQGSVTRAEALIGDAATGGARLVILPEMCATGFTMDVEFAEPVDGPSARRLAQAAARNNVWVLAGLATTGAPGTAPTCAYNSALLFSPTGALLSMYHKQRLFAYAGEHESYATGDQSATTIIEGIRVSPFICYDLRFPELFREVAADTDLMVIIASWPSSRQQHWDVLVRARAIENQCYVVAVNRIGDGGGLHYAGGSAAYDPWGEPLAPTNANGVRIVEVDAARVEEIRSRYPFLADRA